MEEHAFGVRCEVCEWWATAEGQSVGEVSRRAIDHHAETGHLPLERFGTYERSPVEQ